MTAINTVLVTIGVVIALIIVKVSNISSTFGMVIVILLSVAVFGGLLYLFCYLSRLSHRGSGRNELEEEFFNRFPPGEDCSLSGTFEVPGLNSLRKEKFRGVVSQVCAGEMDSDGPKIAGIGTHWELSYDSSGKLLLEVTWNSNDLRGVSLEESRFLVLKRMHKIVDSLKRESQLLNQ